MEERCEIYDMNGLGGVPLSIPTVLSRYLLPTTDMSRPGRENLLLDTFDRQDYPLTDLHIKVAICRAKDHAAGFQPSQ